MQPIINTPTDPTITAGYVGLSKVWVADRNHILNYHIHPVTHQSTWQMRPNSCFISLDILPNEGTLHYIRQGECLHSQPVVRVVCPPKHRLARQLDDELTEAEMLLVLRLAASADHLVLGLDHPIRLQQIKWPSLDKQQMPFTELQFGLDNAPLVAPLQIGYLPPELAYSLAGVAPTLSAVSPGIGNGAFSHDITIEGDYLYGSTRVWWGDVACSFVVEAYSNTYRIKARIPAGVGGPDRKLVVQNQGGSSTDELFFRRF